VGDWQIKALNVDGQPDLINEVEIANDRRSTRTTDAETTFEEIINFCVKKGAHRFLVFDFSCANVADEDRNAVFSTDRAQRYFANSLLKDGTAYGGKTKRTKRKSRKTLKKKSIKKLKKATRKKVTRRRKKNRK
jgi:topoisomerase IA-like protein